MFAPAPIVASFGPSSGRSGCDVRMLLGMVAGCSWPLVYVNVDMDVDKDVDVNELSQWMLFSNPPTLDCCAGPCKPRLPCT